MHGKKHHACTDIAATHTAHQMQLDRRVSYHFHAQSEPSYLDTRTGRIKSESYTSLTDLGPWKDLHVLVIVCARPRELSLSRISSCPQTIQVVKRLEDSRPPLIKCKMKLSEPNDCNKRSGGICN
ncbi:Bypass of stop codon protein 6 [Fusarium oxysporum f. sp. albedinis]|nr:Bypass of stop codon protein 6 [Fusarium oxysporum f. sp. albedinis]